MNIKHGFRESKELRFSVETLAVIQMRASKSGRVRLGRGSYCAHDPVVGSGYYSPGASPHVCSVGNLSVHMPCVMVGLVFDEKHFPCLSFPRRNPAYFLRVMADSLHPLFTVAKVATTALPLLG
ncbi:unnamed protein product [Ectocarpus sp. 12 AP-2014]